MDIKAFKMDGLGNDFVIIDNRQTITNLTKEQIIKICDRKFIGCDQLILIKKNDISDASLEFYNSDGGMSGACGNGTRCIADLLGKENNKKEIVLTTLSGKLKSNIVGEKMVSTEIGIAKTKWDEIPLSKELNTNNLGIKINDKNNNDFSGGTAVNVGNPHVVFFVDNLNFNISSPFLTPPMAMSAYYLKGVQKTAVELLDIFRGIMPFLAIVIFAMFLMYMFPGIALWLPELLFAQ